MRIESALTKQNHAGVSERQDAGSVRGHARTGAGGRTAAILDGRWPYAGGRVAVESRRRPVHWRRHRVPLLQRSISVAGQPALRRHGRLRGRPLARRRGGRLVVLLHVETARGNGPGGGGGHRRRRRREVVE